MSGRFQNKIVLITGGNSGIGLATAKLFVREGAFVYITGRDKGKLDRALAELGPSAAGAFCDISNISELEELFARIGREKGRVDIVFANAGASKYAPIGEITEEHFDWEFDVNVKGSLFTIQLALPLMKNGGSIILNASVTAETGMLNFAIYSATKAALRSLARSATNELAPRGIRVNVVSPGLIPHAAYDELMGREQVEAYVENMSKDIPLRRAGTLDEIATAVAFLASDDASYITGVNLVVDGGLTQI
jgi:NAD(P)-dependent dehydrogenase (short-subunit alcohol dehydrogenase family)